MDYEDVEKILMEKRKRLMTEVNKIDTILGISRGGKAKRGRPVGKSGKKRKMSAAGRKAIAAAQKARWAKIKAAQKK
jgi:hypothetical protein